MPRAGTKLIKDSPVDGNLDKVSDMERAFVLEMLGDSQFRPALAAAKAGYKNPNVAATKLLKRPNIKRLLGKEQAEREQRMRVTADRTLEEVAYCAFRDPIDLCGEDGRIEVSDMRQIPERMRRTIDSIEQKVRTFRGPDGEPVTEVETKLKLVSKATALDMLMRHQGLYTPNEFKIEVKSNEGKSALKRLDLSAETLDEIDRKMGEAGAETVEV